MHKVKWHTLRHRLDRAEAVMTYTWNLHETEAVFWTGPSDLWTELLGCIAFNLADFYHKLGEESLLFNRMNELRESIDWSLLSVYSGSYHSALRNLRAIAEDHIQALYLDQTLKDESIQTKAKTVAILEDAHSKFSGSELVKKCEIPNEIKTSLIQAYQGLSKFVHPRRPTIQDGTLSESSFVYDKELFTITVDFHKQVYDALLAMHLTSFGEVVMKAFLSGMVFKPSEIQDLLKRLDYKLAIKVLEKVK